MYYSEKTENIRNKTIQNRMLKKLSVVCVCVLGHGPTCVHCTRMGLLRRQSCIVLCFVLCVVLPCVVGLCVSYCTVLHGIPEQQQSQDFGWGTLYLYGPREQVAGEAKD